jgi:thioredoxin reductase (NADPH)
MSLIDFSTNTIQLTDEQPLQELQRPPQPVLLAVDADADSRYRIEHELSQRYGRDYHIVCAGSAEAGLRTLHALKAAGEEVAIVLADQWLPGMTGTAFLTQAQQLHPTAKRALLMA